MQTPKRKYRFLLMALIGSLCLAASGAYAQDSSQAPMVKNLTQQQFGPVPGYPDCMRAAGLQGDPSKGPSLLLLRFKSGCTVPWHWHTPGEHLMLASGVGHAQMKGGKVVTLRSGAYAFLPGHNVHMFTCVSRCVLFLSSDGVFDTHYVDSSGKEISPAEALKKN